MNPHNLLVLHSFHGDNLWPHWPLTLVSHLQLLVDRIYWNQTWLAFHDLWKKYKMFLICVIIIITDKINNYVTLIKSHYIFGNRLHVCLVFWKCLWSTLSMGWILFLGSISLWHFHIIIDLFSLKELNLYHRFFK